MKLHERIRQLRKDKGLSLTGLEKRLSEIFGKKALRYNTLFRIEKGLREARPSSLSQISIGLGVSLKKLKEGTDEAERLSARKFVRRDKTAKYVYSEKAVAEILGPETQSFLAMRLQLQPNGRTKVEQDPIESGRFQKWLYCLKGEVTVTVGTERFSLRKDDAFSFESTLPHSIENKTARTASCIIIQNPKHL